jgi:hypothetical protein
MQGKIFCALLGRVNCYKIHKIHLHIQYIQYINVKVSKDRKSERHPVQNYVL